MLALKDRFKGVLKPCTGSWLINSCSWRSVFSPLFLYYMPAFFSGKIQLCSSWPEAVLHSKRRFAPSLPLLSPWFFGTHPFRTGICRQQTLRRELLHPVGTSSRHHKLPLAEKCVGNLVWRCLSKGCIPLSLGEITSHHMPPSAAPSDTMQLGNEVWTHRRAAPKTVLLITLDAGFLPWACPQGLDSCTVPVLDIWGSPGWYQWVWSPGQPTQLSGHGAHGPGKGRRGLPQLGTGRAPYNQKLHSANRFGLIWLPETRLWIKFLLWVVQHIKACVLNVHFHKASPQYTNRWGPGKHSVHALALPSHVHGTRHSQAGFCISQYQGLCKERCEAGAEALLLCWLTSAGSPG